MKKVILKINNLNISLWQEGGMRPLVKGLNFEVRENQTVALVGSSGSGKTTTALAVLRLLAPNIQVHAGEILFNNENLLTANEQHMRQVRGREIAMVFQEPLSAFNPVFSIATQINEVLVYHTDLNGQQRRERILHLLDMVGVPDPKRVARAYPHQLSGGLRQRAMIAQAIAAQPQLLIADEPTSNLDVTLQARILELFKRLSQEMNMAVMLITHDLGVVRHLADYAAVMYNGRVVDFGKTEEVMTSPVHSFTKELIEILNR